MKLRIFFLFLLVFLTGGEVSAQSSPQLPSDLAGTGYFRDQDTLPSSFRLYRQIPGGVGGLVTELGPGQERPRRSSFKLDAHEGVPNYSPRSSCTDCHKDEAKDLHQVRMGIVCVQCHRSAPISGVYHYYSPLNPIRRHAYVCAKCHEGATPSFAAYVVHEPNPLLSQARDEFPGLYYVVWFMMILAVGVFVVFIPYVILWWFRELVAKLLGKASHG